jgi:hypothetical protein
VTQYRLVVRGFVYVTAVVCIVIGIGVSLVGGLTYGTVEGTLVPETALAPGVGIIGAARGTIGVVHALQGSRVVATSSIQSADYTFDDSAEFSLRLPPGHYRLNASLVSFPCAIADVEVRAKATVSVNIICLLRSGDAS